MGGYRVGDGTFPIYDNWYETNSGGEVGVGLEVPLLRDGPIDRRRANIGKAESGLQIADSLIEQRKIELARAAALTYWDWTAARNRIKVYRRLLQVAQERDKQIAERVARGDLPDFDRVDNQRAVLQRQAQLLTAERGVKSAEFALSLFYRNAASEPQSVERFQSLDRIPVPLFAPVHTTNDSVAEAADARPEFKNIKAQSNQNKIELELARNQVLPRLDLRVFSYNDYGTGNPDLEEPEVKAGLRIEIPLATRTQQGRIDYFESRERKLQFTETFLRERIRADVQDALNALDIARSRVEVASAEVKASEELAQGELKRFNFGDSNLIFVNLREQNAADAQVREVDALQDYQKAFVTFEAILARIQKRQGDTK
jgi:outer membrane protein TolC